MFYHDGIGTRGPLDHFTGGAFGHGMEGNIRTLYRFIVYNFERDDELFLFGFSRGAFTVRSLAGFMKMVGLIHKDDDYYLPEIYHCYENAKGPGHPSGRRRFTESRKGGHVRRSGSLEFGTPWAASVRLDFLASC